MVRKGTADMKTLFVVVDQNNDNYRPLGSKTFDSIGAAKRSATCSNKRALKNLRVRRDRYKMSQSEYVRELDSLPCYTVMSLEAYNAQDILVSTYNMLDPERRVIMIRKSLKGGCCDPATETYHSM